MIININFKFEFQSLLIVIYNFFCTIDNSDHVTLKFHKM